MMGDPTVPTRIRDFRFDFVVWERFLLWTNTTYVYNLLLSSVYIATHILSKISQYVLAVTVISGLMQFTTKTQPQNTVDISLLLGKYCFHFFVYFLQWARLHPLLFFVTVFTKWTQVSTVVTILLKIYFSSWDRTKNLKTDPCFVVLWLYVNWFGGHNTINSNLVLHF